VADSRERNTPPDELRQSRDQLQVILRGVTDGVTAQDATGKLIFANAAAVRTLGFDTAEQLLAAPVAELMQRFELFDEEGRPFPIDHLPSRVALATHAAAPEVTLRFRIKESGEEHWSLVSANPILDDEGRARGVINIFRDVTLRRREAERRLFVAEASSVLASSLDFATTLATVARLAVPRVADSCIVHILESGGGVRQVAAAHDDPSKARAALEVERRTPPDPAIEEWVTRVLRTGKPEVNGSRMIVPLRARDHTLGALTLVATAAGAVFREGDLAFAEQLATAAAMAVDNARLYHEAQEANRLKDEFLATVSHELRTPLNAMLGWARLLRAGELAPEMNERALAAIERNALAQAQLIEDLLDVSRIITGKLRLDVRSIEVARVIDSAVDAVRPAADAKGLRIDVSVDRMVGTISADAARLEQVAWNLLSNAVKFTPRGGRVLVSASLVESHLELAVSDNGAGIRPDFLPLVFDRFRQADNRGTQSHTGLGLGLSIARHLVELHGGAIRAESDGEGKGATFTVVLPIAAVYRDDAPSQSGLGLTSVEVPPLDGVRIVVVDDEDDGRELITMILEQLGAQVMAAASAEDAISAVKRFAPHVLVSDIGMPGEDGYSLIRRIRALSPEQGGTVAAAALTAYARAEDRTRALLAGFQQHLVKPIEPKELAVVVANLAGRTTHT
jgi:PAS domain S-box-containing protein